MLFCFCKISGLEESVPEADSSGNVVGGTEAAAESAESAAGLSLFHKLDT